VISVRGRGLGVCANGRRRFARVTHAALPRQTGHCRDIVKAANPERFCSVYFSWRSRYIGGVRSMHVAVEGSSIMWNQVYDPFNNWIFSTLCAALPVVTLLVLIASNKVKAHIAAIVALIVANLVAIFIFTMPSGLCREACQVS